MPHSFIIDRYVTSKNKSLLRILYNGLFFCDLRKLLCLLDEIGNKKIKKLLLKNLAGILKARTFALAIER